MASNIWKGSKLPLVVRHVAPTTADISYQVPTLWLNDVTDRLYFLVDITAGVAIWYESATSALPMTMATNPAINAAVSTANIDGYSGVVITLTAAGNAQTIQDPTVLIAGKEFTVVNNDTSTHSIPINGFTLEPGEAQSFIWDETAWCSNEAFQGATNTTKLAITGTIAASTNFTTTASGTSYIFSGDAGDLLASAALFAAAEYIEVMLNGIYLAKGVNVTWQSQTSFQLDIIVDSGDEIIILS